MLARATTLRRVERPSAATGERTERAERTAGKDVE